MEPEKKKTFAQQLATLHVPVPVAAVGVTLFLAALWLYARPFAAMVEATPFLKWFVGITKSFNFGDRSNQAYSTDDSALKLLIRNHYDFVRLSPVVVLSVFWAYAHYRIAASKSFIAFGLNRVLHWVLTLLGIFIGLVLMAITDSHIAAKNFETISINALVFVAFGLPPLLKRHWPLSFASIAVFYTALSMDLLILGYPGCTSAFLLNLIVFHNRAHAAYWWPSQLPKIKNRSGFTLIELLIVIAIVFILALGLARVVETAHLASHRQEEWNDAIELAESQIALIRSGESPIEIGTHPADARLSEFHPLAKQALVEVKPGPSDGLAEVTVNVRLSSHAQDRVVSLAAIIPTRAMEGTAK